MMRHRPRNFRWIREPPPPLECFDLHFLRDFQGLSRPLNQSWTVNAHSNRGNAHTELDRGILLDFGGGESWKWR